MMFVLALLSKTAVVMLPVVLLGVVWWKRGPLRWRDIGHSVPFFVLSASLGLLTIRFQEQHRLALDLPSSSVGLASHLAVAGSVPWFYLCKAVWPVHLAVIYPQWQINDSQWASFLFGVALVGALLLFWWKRTSWGRPLLFALGCFIVMLFPVMGFFDQTFYRYASVADHWQYYSIVAPIALIAAAAHKIHDRLSQHQQTLAEAIAAAVLLSLAVSTWTRASTYVDNATLWRDNVLKYPTAYVAHHNLGVALAQAGKPEEAVDYFKETVHLKPDFADAHYNLGSALAQLGRLPEALPHFEQAVRLKPAKAEFQNNYANALMLAGQFPAAVEHYTQSVIYNPTSAETRCNLAVALERMGRLDEARAEYEEALRLNPDSADAQDGLRRLGAGK
jgi:tetratricopeptide (TPR) repeat protein